MLTVDLFNRKLTSQASWILDGAVGTMLESRGYKTTLPFWTAFASTDCPEWLCEVYDQYIQAGVDILTANTFRISQYLFSKHKYLDLYEKLLDECSLLARKTIAGRSILLAASITTLEDCYRPDLAPDEDILYKHHEIHLDTLLCKDFDIVIAETINTKREAEVICKMAKEKGIPLLLSLISNGKGQLLSGEDLAETVTSLKDFGPSAILLNCRPIEDLLYDGKILANCFNGNKGVYANAPGRPDPECGWEVKESATSLFCDGTQKLNDMGFTMFGGCCGTNPEMIATMKERLVGPK